MDPKPLKIAHISDLHFSKLSLNPFQIFSKRWLGTANLLLKRGRVHIRDKAFSLIEALKTEGITDLFISGDLTTTSQHSEYKIAQAFIAQLKGLGINVLVIPGNHDHYTGRSHKEQRFYRYFENDYPALERLPLSLKEDHVAGYQLRNGWWVVMLDTTARRSILQSNGVYSSELDKKLRYALSLIPQHAPIILMNHFPFFQHEGKYRALEGGPLLEHTVRAHRNILFYLHGHTHRRCLADLRVSGLPIVTDSGSLSHLHRGSWSSIELLEKEAHLTIFTSNEKRPIKWEPIHKESFHFVV